MLFRSLDAALIDEAKRRTDLVALVARDGVRFERRGREYWASCPLHGEATPSFHVLPERGFWKCFGCGQGGDAISYLMATRRLDFPRAARQLAEATGLLAGGGPAAFSARTAEQAAEAAARDLAAAKQRHQKAREMAYAVWKSAAPGHA